MKQKKSFDRSRTPTKTVHAIFPKKHKVRELELNPMSLNSFIALDKLGSPLLSGKYKMGLADLANALFVC
jgi:hypothetical protein